MARYSRLLFEGDGGCWYGLGVDGDDRLDRDVSTVIGFVEL